MSEPTEEQTAPVLVAFRLHALQAAQLDQMAADEGLSRADIARRAVLRDIHRSTTS